ncbi:MAG: hypothetical protein KDD73_13410 [Anaerolineales bacterium]|nr:hypothetical protein [Anaerolineales bacterium]
MRLTPTSLLASTQRHNLLRSVTSLLIGCGLLLLTALTTQAQTEGQRIEVRVIDASAAPVGALNVRFVAEDGIEYGGCTTSSQGRCQIEVDPAVPVVGVTLRGMLEVGERGRVPVIWLIRDGVAPAQIQLDANGQADVPHDVLATRAPNVDFPTPVTPQELAATATALVSGQATVTPPPGIEVTASAAMAAQTATAAVRKKPTPTPEAPTAEQGATASPPGAPVALGAQATAVPTSDPTLTAHSTGPDWPLIALLGIAALLLTGVIVAFRRTGNRA